MPGSTAKGFRYPNDTDPVANGALAVRNLANDVNDKVGLIATGVQAINVAASTTATVNNIALPAGRFTAAPHIVATADSGAFNVAVQNITTTTFTLVVRHIDAASTTVTVNVHWVAVQ